MRTKNTTIRVEDGSCAVSMIWTSFDGDDCFNAFTISVREAGKVPHAYNFGPCAVWCLRKMREFVSDPGVGTVGGGFRNPDIRTYDWYRDGENLRLDIQFVGTGLNHRFSLTNPSFTEECSS